MTKAERAGSVARAGSIAQYRRRVPSDLVGVIGLTEIKKSLRTRDPAAARVAQRQYDLEVEQRFAAARARLPVALPAKLRRNAPKETLSAEDRAFILALVEHRLLDRDDDVRKSSAASDDEQWNMYLDLSAEELALARQFAKGIAPRFRVQLEGDLASAGLKLDPLSSDYVSLARDYNRLIADTLEKIGERVGGRRYTPTPPEPTPTGTPKARGSRVDPSTPTLQSVLQQWKAEHQPKEQSASEARLVVDEFVALAKVSVLKDIKKAHVVAFKDWCREQPGKQKGTLAAVATVRKRLSVIKTLLAYAERNDLVGSNVAHSVTVGGSKVRQGGGRAHFEKSHFATIFTSSIYTSRHRPVAGGGEAAYWIPLVAAMSGMRLEEIGCRSVADVKEQDGVAFIEVHDRGEGQSVKTEGSRREVPVHSELIRLGFLDYVKHVRAGNHQRLFPDLRRAGSAVQKGKATKTYSQWWGRWMEKELKITDPSLVFHSFRHAFKRFARDTEVKTEISDLLTGHSSGNVGSTYGRGASIVTLKDAIEKIKFADLMPQIISWTAIQKPNRTSVAEASVVAEASILAEA